MRANRRKQSPPFAKGGDCDICEWLYRLLRLLSLFAQELKRMLINGFHVNPDVSLFDANQTFAGTTIGEAEYNAIFEPF